MLESRGRKERSVVRTFRLPEKLCEDLKKEAQENMESLNTRVNQVLHEHVYDYWPPAMQGELELPKAVFARLLTRISEKEAREIGRDVALKYSRSKIIGQWGIINTDTILALFRLIAERSGFGQYRDVTERDRRIVSIMHEMGPNCSAWLAGSLETLFQMVDVGPDGSVEAKVMTTDEAVIVEIFD